MKSPFKDEYVEFLKEFSDTTITEESDTESDNETSYSLFEKELSVNITVSIFCDEPNSDLISEEVSDSKIRYYRPKYSSKKIGHYSIEERKERIQRWMKKRLRMINNRRLKKKIVRYQCRKAFADSRPRVGGRFIKKEK